MRQFKILPSTYRTRNSSQSSGIKFLLRLFYDFDWRHSTPFMVPTLYRTINKKIQQNAIPQSKPTHMLYFFFAACNKPPPLYWKPHGRDMIMNTIGNLWNYLGLNGLWENNPYTNWNCDSMFVYVFFIIFLLFWILKKYFKIWQSKKSGNTGALKTKK